MKYLKKFTAETDYNAFVASSSYVTPNVCVINEGGEDETHFNPYVPPKKTVAGQVCYYDGSKLDFVDYTEWDNSLGTAVGIVVVPNTHTPDGTSRICAISGVTSGGTASSSEKYMSWGVYGTDTGLPNLNKVPIFNNTASATISNNGSGFLPSDKGFTGATCVTDATAKYSQTSNLIPSPYLADGTQNPDYVNTAGATTANCLSDFDGAGNTSVLVGLGTSYVAASACSLYSTEYLTAGRWYLPAAGELGYIMPRFNVINAALQAVGGVQFKGDDYYWSSSEHDSGDARYVDPRFGYVNYRSKNGDVFVRPFASV